MASNTTNFNLYKKDPVEDAADTFNIKTMLNDNWDKIDQNAQKKITASGMLKCNGEGGVSPADLAALHDLLNLSDAATVKILLDKLASVTPEAGDKIPLTDISGGIAGFATIADILGVGVKIATVTYTGTGLSGVDNPNSVTFDFAPKILMAFRANGKISHTGSDVRNTPGHIGYAGNLTTEYVANTLWDANYNSNTLYAKKSADGKTISWYYASTSGQNAAECSTFQNNTAGEAYTIVGITW